MMMKKLLFMAALLLYATMALAQTNVSNIRIEQQDSLLHVFYNLDVKSDISIYFSKDNGQTFSGPLTGVVGDVGKDVTQGKDKLIIWDVVKEAGYIDINSAKVKIVANAIEEAKSVVSPRRKRIFEWRNLIMVGASWTSETPFSYSFIYGRYKKFGYYVKAESNFKFLQKTDADASANAHDVFWDGTGNYSRIAGYAGGIWNFSRYAMLNIGIGYSHQTIIGNTIGNQKVSYGEGLEDVNVELGVIINFGNVSIGANILCLPTFETTVAVGGGISLGVNF